MPKILVTDCWTRKTLSAVRSLGREGLVVDAVSHTRIAPGIYSSYTRRYFIVPDPKKQPELYLKKILELIQQEQYDCIMPFEESSIELFLTVRTQIEQYTRLPLPSAKAYHAANNKWEVLQLARQLNIPMPQSYRPQSQAGIDEALNALQFPVIIKPVSSSGSRGIRKVANRQQFDKEYPEVVKNYGYPVIQQCIDWQGQGCGVGVLARDGNVLADFSYKRLREFPVQGGPSTARESTADGETKQYAAKLLKALNWDGVAMVEFKRDPVTNTPMLMEINPRFWGSLDLSYVAGVNFPYLLYLFATGKEVKQPSYTTGIIGRWLLPGDMAHFLANPNRFKLRPSFFSFVNGHTYYDDFKKDDLKGNIATVLCTIAMVFDPEIWKIGVFRK